MGQRILSLAALLAATALMAGCERSVSRNSAGEAEASENSEPVDATEQGDVETAYAGGNDELWNACWTRMVGGEPYRISDVVEVGRQNNRNFEIEREGNQIILRNNWYDALQRRDMENSFEFVVTHRPAQSSYCGPLNLALSRAVIDGRMVSSLQERVMIEMELGGIADRSVEGRRRAAERSAQHRAQREVEADEQRRRQAEINSGQLAGNVASTVGDPYNDEQLNVSE